MLSAGTTERPRILLDESSFDFRQLSDDQIERHLDELNVALGELRSQVARPPMWDAVECLDDCELSRFLSRAHSSAVDRDTLVLTYRLLDRAPEWEPRAGAEMSASIGGGATQLALSVAYALKLAIVERRGAACLVFPGSPRRGFLPVRRAHPARPSCSSSTPPQRSPRSWHSRQCRGDTTARRRPRQRNVPLRVARQVGTPPQPHPLRRTGRGSRRQNTYRNVC